MCMKSGCRASGEDFAHAKATIKASAFIVKNVWTVIIILTTVHTSVVVFLHRLFSHFRELKQLHSLSSGFFKTHFILSVVLLRGISVICEDIPQNIFQIGEEVSAGNHGHFHVVECLYIFKIFHCNYYIYIE